MTDDAACTSCGVILWLYPGEDRDLCAECQWRPPRRPGAAASELSAEEREREYQRQYRQRPEVVERTCKYQRAYRQTAKGKKAAREASRRWREKQTRGL